MDDLPEELLLRLCICFLDQRDLAVLSRLSTKFYRIATGVLYRRLDLLPKRVPVSSRYTRANINDCIAALVRHQRQASVRCVELGCSWFKEARTWIVPAPETLALVQSLPEVHSFQNLQAFVGGYYYEEIQTFGVLVSLSNLESLVLRFVGPKSKLYPDVGHGQIYPKGYDDLVKLQSATLKRRFDEGMVAWLQGQMTPNKFQNLSNVKLYGPWSLLGQYEVRSDTIPDNHCALALISLLLRQPTLRSLVLVRWDLRVRGDHIWHKPHRLLRKLRNRARHPRHVQLVDYVAQRHHRDHEQVVQAVWKCEPRQSRIRHLTLDECTLQPSDLVRLLDSCRGLELFHNISSDQGHWVSPSPDIESTIIDRKPSDSLRHHAPTMKHLVTNTGYLYQQSRLHTQHLMDDLIEHNGLEYLGVTGVQNFYMSSTERVRMPASLVRLDLIMSSYSVPLGVGTQDIHYLVPWNKERVEIVLTIGRLVDQFRFSRMIVNQR